MRAEAPGSPEHQTANTRHNHQKKDTPGRPEAAGHQKRNTNSSDQHQRTKINRSRQQEEKQNRGGRTTKTSKTKRKTPPGKQKPQSAKRQTPTTNHSHSGKKTNTPGWRAPQRQKSKHQPQPTKGIETARAGGSPRAPHTSQQKRKKERKKDNQPLHRMAAKDTQSDLTPRANKP